MADNKSEKAYLELPYFVNFTDDATAEDVREYYKLYYKQRAELEKNKTKRYIVMTKPTEEQIKEASEYLKRWDKKEVFKFGYLFKLIDDTHMQVSKENQKEFMVVKIK